MKKSVMSIMCGIGLMGLVGCNHVSSIGRIGGTEYHAVRTTDISGPNAVVIIAVDANGNQTIASFGTSGILPSAISAGGQVAAADVFESGSDSVHVNTSTNTKVNASPWRPVTPAHP